MQRLTKYKILIEAIRKHIVDETEIELVDVMVSYLLLYLTVKFYAVSNIPQIESESQRRSFNVAV